MSGQTQRSSRSPQQRLLFGGKADISRQTKFAGSVENEPQRSSATEIDMVGSPPASSK
jgi:hypothetical protein